MRHLILRIATWILSRLAQAEHRESLVGDLTEEYALRANATSSSAACNWQLRQIYASTSSLLWYRLAHAAWISTLGVALLAYIVVGVVEFTANWAILHALPTGTRTYTPLELIITVPAVMLIGYFAARFRRAAAAVLGVMMLLVVTAMMLSSTEHMPLWYQIVYFWVGPAAAFIGGRLRAATARKGLASFPPP
jgi:Solute carrier family 35